MEIDEVVARLTKRYWPLLLVAIVVPVIVVAMVLARQPKQYTAQSRVAVSADVPKSAAESAALVSQVDALASSRDLVARALGAAHVSNRDPSSVARNDVAVTGNGTSAVVTISVTDPDPKVAAAVAGTLASEVNTAFNASRIGNLPSVIAGVDRQLNQLATRRAPIAAAVAASQAQRTPDPKLPLFQSELAGVDTLIADLSSDRNRLSEELAGAGNASVVDSPNVPQHPNSPGTTQKLGLAAILGLVAGLLIAALAETIRPTVSGAARLGRMLSAPLLGRLEANPAVLLALGRRVRLAARKSSVQQIVVTSASGKPVPDWAIDRLCSVVLPPLRTPASAPDRVPVPVLAQQNGSPARPAALDNSPVPNGASGSADQVLRVSALEDLDAAQENASVGVLVLAGGSTNANAVHEIRDLLAASGWPLLGVVAHPRFGRR